MQAVLTRMVLAIMLRLLVLSGGVVCALCCVRTEEEKPCED